MTDWVPIETGVLRAARNRVGLSYEGVARQVPVSSKTYERWEKQGRIPRADLPRVAEVLQLEIESHDTPPLRVRVAGRGITEDLGSEILIRLERIEKLLRNRPAS